MKKLLLLGAAALLGFSSGHADTFFTEGAKVESADQLTTGKYILVAVSKGNEKLLKYYNQTSATTRFSDQTYLPDTGADGDFVWDITVSGEGNDKTFTLKPAYHENWLSKIGQQGGDENCAKGNVQSTTNEDDIATFKLVEVPDDQLTGGTFQIPGTRFYVQLTNNEFVGDNGNTPAYFYTNSSGTDQKLSYWETTGTFFGSGACTAIMFVKLDNFNGSATFNWPSLNGNQITKSVTGDGSSEFTVPDFAGFNLNGSLNKVFPATTTALTVNMGGTWADWIQLPMNTPMRLRLRNGDTNSGTYTYMKYMHTANQTRSIDLVQPDDENIEPERIWYFKNAGFDVENGVQTVTLHNLGEPDNKGLAIGSGNGNRPSLSTSPTILSLAPNTIATGGFSLRRGTSGNVYINDYNGDGGLSIWVAAAATNDNGSYMRYELLTESDVTHMASYHVAGVGNFAYDSKKHVAAMANVTVEKLREMTQYVCTSNLENYFNDTQYYRMLFNRNSQYHLSVANGAAIAGDTENPLGEAADDRRVLPITASASDANQIWQIVRKDGTEHLQIISPNAHGYYIEQKTGNNSGITLVKDSQTPGEFAPTYDIYEQGWLLKFNGRDGYLSNFGGRDGIGSWGSAYSDAGNKIIISLAETIDYTIPEGAEYGAVCYPFGIVLPEGVTAYIATQVNTDGSLRLVQVPGNSVPENTPVLIKNSGEAGTIHFGIHKVHATPTEQKLLARNVLSGTLIKTKGFTANDHCLLTAEGNKFAKDEAELIAANTTYLASTVLTADADEIALAEPVTTSTYNVTFQFPPINGHAFSHTFEQVIDGTKIPELFEICELPVQFTFNTTEELNNKVVDSDMTVSVSGTWGYPAIEFGRIYRIAFRNKSVNNCNNFVLTANNQIDTRNNTNADDLVPERLFYFKEAAGSTPEALKVTFHSVKLGDAMGISLPKNAEGVVANNAKVTFTDTPDVFEILSSGNTAAEYKDSYAFVLKVTSPTVNDNNTAVDGHLNDVSGLLGTWNDGGSRNDGGSAFKFFEIADAEIDALGATEELTARLKQTMNHEDFMAAYNDGKDILKANSRVIFTNRNREEGTKLYASNNSTTVGSKPQADGWANTWKVIMVSEEPVSYSFLNEYSGKYIGHLPTSGGSEEQPGLNIHIPLVESLEDAGQYIVEKKDGGYISLVENLPAGSFAPTANAIHSASGDAAVRWYHRDGDDEASQFSFIHVSDATIEGWADAALSIAPYVDSEHSNELGYLPYSAEIKAGFDALAENKFNAAAYKIVEPYVTNFDALLKKPQVGHIYQLGRVDGTKYLSSRLATSNSRMSMVDMSDNELVGTLFYYDENSHLVSLENGMVISNGTNRTTTFASATNTGTIEFFAAQPGLFFIGAGMDGNSKRFLYNVGSTLDSGTSSVAGTDVSSPYDDRIGYKWKVELHEGSQWVPIAGTEQDLATICLPRTMKIRDTGMKVFSAELQNNKVVLTEVGEPYAVLPANVPFIVEFNGVQRGSNNLVYLETAGDSETPVEAPENNILEGSIYAQANEAPIYTFNGSRFVASTPEQTTYGQAYLREVPADHTISNKVLEDQLDALVGKLFYIKSNKQRGCLIYQENTETIWSSAKNNVSENVVDDVAAGNANYHWTLVKENGKRYLYNPAAGKFASAFYSKPVEAPIAEFAWHFSDYPTAIDFEFYDYDVVSNLETATFNILGGENNNHTRPAGMMINLGCREPVPVATGTAANDGCGFTVHVVEGSAPADIPSVAEALTAMNAEHSAAASYINEHEESHCEVPGHFNTTGYEAFSTAMNAATADDTESKYFTLTRARKAAGNNITAFANGVYNLYENGEPLAAKITWDETNGSTFYLGVGTYEQGKDATTSINWRCEVNEETGAVEFTHKFGVPVNTVRGDATTPTNKVRARVEGELREETMSMAEAAVPTYDGFGNITLGDKKLTSSAPLGDASTTGISELTADGNNDDAVVYDLQGRRVAKAGRGLYIVNGKKTFLK